jgi:hypothetical protein
MKTQEEIEQLAKKQKGCSKEYCDSIDEQYGYLNGYIDGYTQCQEDMVDKKYREEDIRDILENYFSHITCHISQYCDKEDLQQPYEWLDINVHSLSLNKQD